MIKEVLVVEGKMDVVAIDKAVEAGITKILNFSSAKPAVPPHVLVEHLNIALSLAALKHTEV